MAWPFRSRDQLFRLATRALAVALLPAAGLVAPGRARQVACQWALAARFPAEDLTGLTPATRTAFVAARTRALWRDGVLIGLTSGHRPADEQQRLFAMDVRRTGSEAAARSRTLPAAESRHCAGTALDVRPREGARWLECHGDKHDLYRFYDNEWWHFEHRPEGRPPRLAHPGVALAPHTERNPMISRRKLLVGALALPLVACGTQVPTRRPAPTTSTTPPADTDAANARFSALEHKYRTRLGLYAVATGSGTSVAYRADDRFAFCSTFKAHVAAAVLDRHQLSYLEHKVPIHKTDVDSISPVTEHHIGSEMTIRQLCDAAVRYSDGTAGNLLMRDIGGPAALTAYLRGLGDTVSRMDQYEPALNRNAPGDPRDTTTPRTIANDFRRLVLGDALPANKRSILTAWLKNNTTGAQDIRAGLPTGWIVADKTGHGDYGRANDIAIAWPPTGAPLVISILTDRPTYGYGAESEYAIIAEAAAYLTTML